MVKEIVDKIILNDTLDFVIFADFYQDAAYFTSIRILKNFDQDDLKSIFNIKLAPINPMQASATIVIRDE